nr:reverse transcriptase domain-containing protein [Tanacetum cinerariifolium]
MFTSRGPIRRGRSSAPPSPDYIPVPEEPEQAPPLPDYVIGPEHADDEIVAEDQPYAEDASPTVQSPEYEGSSEDDEDDDMDNKADEEEEHPAPADSIVIALQAADQAPSAEEIEPFETDESAAKPSPHPAYRMIARISIPAPVPVPAWSDLEVVRLLAMSSLPSSLLSPLSSPAPRIPFPQLPPILSPPSPIRCTFIKDTTTLTYISSYSSPPLQLPSASRREDRPEVTLPPWNRLGIALGHRYEVGESSSAAAARPAGGLRADYGFVATIDREIRRDPERGVGYGITDSWDEIVETLQGAPVSTNTELGRYMREFETRVRRDTNEIYSRLNDEQSERQLLAGRLNMLIKKRRVHSYTCHLMETEAWLSREAWVQSVDASDLAHGKVMSVCTTILDHRRSAEIRGLRTADRTQQQHLIQTLTVMHTLQGQVTTLQGQVTALQGHVIALQAQVTTLQGQQGPAGGPTQPELPEEASSNQETTNTTSVINAQLQAMIDQGVTAALAARDALRSTNGDDSHNSGTGVRRTERATRECTYTDFLKCQPLHFKDTEGVASLSQWFERMESIFHISNCAVENQVKFITCTLYSVALTWWNTYVKIVGHDAAYASKRKFENTSRSTQNQQQQPNKRQNSGRVYTAASCEKKQYGGSKPLCAKCNYHHDGPCAPKCQKCNKVGHFARDNANNQRGIGSCQKPTCYEYGVQGHFKRECTKLRNNNNHGNQGRTNNAPAKVYVLGRAGTDPDSNVVTGTFLLNNRYASVLFDTGADKSFVSTAFSTQINITPSTLDCCYDVELADGRIIRLNTILRGCTLNLLDHPFNINLIPLELGSFDAIIDMDWLAKYQAVIAYAEKTVRIPWGNETLIIHGDGSNQENA